MINNLFAAILGMSMTAAIAILVLLLVGAVLKKIKAPALLRYALWAVVLFRLLVPFSFASEVSLFKLGFLQQPIQIAENISEPQPRLPQQHEAILNTPAPTPPASPPANGGPTAAPPNSVPALIWLSGVMTLLGYHAISYLKLKRTLTTAICVEKNIYRSDRISSPFVCGLRHPKMYLPCSLGEKEYGYILLHEQIHIKRFDYLVKPLWLAVCCLHWFNPLAWFALFCMCEDMEQSCDEAVLQQLGDGVKLDYSRSMVVLAARRPLLSGALPGFGQHKTKNRVNHVLNYKKPLLGTVVLAVAVTAITAYVLAANAPPQPQEVAALPPEAPEEQPKLTDEELQRFVTERLAAYQDMAADSPLTKPEADAPQAAEEPQKLLDEEQAAAAAAEEKIREILAKRAAIASRTAPAHQLAWPYWGKGISAGFGYRSLGYHSGIDIMGPVGDSVAAAEAGEVTLAEWYGNYGNLVIIDHGGELQTYYGHLSAFAVEEGDIVERGQIIGAIGTTGRATEPQLHFEVRNKDMAQDPLEYLENEEKSAE